MNEMPEVFFFYEFPSPLDLQYPRRHLGDITVTLAFLLYALRRQDFIWGGRGAFSLNCLQFIIAICGGRGEGRPFMLRHNWEENSHLGFSCHRLHSSPRGLSIS